MAEAGQHGVGIVPSIAVLAARQEAGRIVADRSDANVSRAIEEQEMFLYRGAFAAAEMRALRRAIAAWGRANPAFPPGQSASRPFLNFHRIDDGRQPSHLPHIFHVYGFGDPAALPEALRDPLGRAGALLMDLQNRLAGTRFDLVSGVYKIATLRHPRGGGYLADHIHPYLPQKVSLFLGLSEPGTDHAAGEARFNMRGRWISTFAQFRCGDILAWRFDRPHGVSPVDPGTPIDWAAEDGLWLLSLEAVATHQKSRAA